VGRNLLVEADGGSRGNPGVAGYGAVVRDAGSKRVLAERAAPLGTASNNVAEYSGLVAGLQAVLDLGLADDARIEVRMDSKLVVEQMSGRWKIKHEDMRRLALEARDLARQIEWVGGRVSYTWVPRDRNKAADALSNDGMDGRTVRRDFVHDEAGDGEPAGAPDAVAGQRPPGVPAAGEAPAPTFGEVRAPVTDILLSTETTPTLEGACRLVLVRHGVTAYTESHKLDGRGGSNPPLSDLGQRQAKAAAGAVKDLVERSGTTPVTVITSSLSRAVQTGAAVAEALGVAPDVDRDWDEQGFGDWDGLSMTELSERFGPELLRLRQDADYTRPGGESTSQLIERVTAALSRAVARGGTVVGIDHDKVWSIATAPASLTAFEFWPDGGVQVAFVNDTHHLHHLA
jgi:probable phosphoglycerate mutase